MSLNEPTEKMSPSVSTLPFHLGLKNAFLRLVNHVVWLMKISKLERTNNLIWFERKDKDYRVGLLLSTQPSHRMKDILSFREDMKKKGLTPWWDE